MDGIGQFGRLIHLFISLAKFIDRKPFTSIVNWNILQTDTDFMALMLEPINGLYYTTTPLSLQALISKQWLS